MTISALTCPPPVRRTAVVTRPDFDRLDSAIELYERGAWAESLAQVFAHLFPDRAVPDLAVEPFTFGQGSSRVSVRIDGDMLRITVPMVRLRPEGSTTAALRFLLSRISGSGQLHQPRLHGDEVVLEFADRLTRLHPHKVLEALRRMPVEADASDDWMVEQFAAESLDREPIEALGAEELEQAEAIWRAHWEEVEELLKASQRKRSIFFLNELTAYAVHHVRHALPLSGYLWARISASADTFNDTHYDPSTREAALAKCIKEMKAVPLETLKHDLGHARYAISPLSDGTPQVLTSNLGPGQYLDTIGQLRGAGRYMEAAVGLIGTYNFLLARFSWPPAVEAMLLEGLALASGRGWREATNALLGHARVLVAAFGGSGDDEGDEGDDGDDDEGGAEVSA